jgi:hypothetical protein
VINLPFHLLADNPLPLNCDSGHNTLQRCFSLIGLILMTSAAVEILYLPCKGPVICILQCLCDS